MTIEQARLDGIQKLIVQRQFSRALDDISRLLESDAGHADLLYMAAVCHRYEKRFDAALGFIERLKAVTPGNGRAHQEEAHNYRDMGRNEEALRAYGRAFYYNPALIVSLREQIRLLKAAGDTERWPPLQARLDELQKMPQPLVAVLDLMSQNKLLQAENLCRQFLQKVPHHVQAMRLLAEIGVQFGVLEDAEFLLESAVEFEPDNQPARIDYIQILRKRQKFAQALAEAEKLLQAQPDNPQYQSIYAVECMQAGDFDKALDSFNRVLKSVPHDPVTLTSIGHVHKTRGDSDAAITAYHDAIAAHPNHGEAYYSLANLKTYQFSVAEIEAMLAQEGNRNLPQQDQVYLQFALGKALEDEGDYAQSFRHYQRGNDLKRAQSRYNAEQITADLAAQREVCTADFFAGRRGSGCEAADPIFIVGLPRAGSTLLEQILSSHSQVDGTLELPNILSLSQQLRRRRRDGDAPDYPQILETLTQDELREFGEQYLSDTRIHRQGAPFFIDKMPNNFRHIGLIKLILPNAKIIDARRHPLACCLSGYKQLFAEGQEFSYSLADLGHYYRDYVALMDHWDQVLPDFVLRVNNEDVIEDLESEVRRMLDFCGLPFEENCLHYYRTERNVRTPSSEQVRKPISRAGIDQWRHYADFLDPLREALGPLAELSERRATTDAAESDNEPVVAQGIS